MCNVREIHWPMTLNWRRPPPAVLDCPFFSDLYTPKRKFNKHILAPSEKSQTCVSTIINNTHWPNLVIIINDQLPSHWSFPQAHWRMMPLLLWSDEQIHLHSPTKTFSFSTHFQQIQLLSKGYSCSWINQILTKIRWNKQAQILENPSLC